MRKSKKSMKLRKTMRGGAGGFQTNWQFSNPENVVIIKPKTPEQISAAQQQIHSNLEKLRAMGFSTGQHKTQTSTAAVKTTQNKKANFLTRFQGRKFTGIKGHNTGICRSTKTPNIWPTKTPKTPINFIYF